jgi:hypothetical protein
MRRYIFATSLIGVAALALTGAPTAAFAEATHGYGQIAVQLVTSEGKPLALAGVKVNADRFGSSDVYGVTDATGAVLLTRVEAHAGFNVYTETPRNGASTYTPGWLEQTFEVHTDTTEHVKIVTDLGATITGKVVGPDGKPIPEIRISAAANTGISHLEESITDANGIYSFVGLRSANYALYGAANDFAYSTNWKTQVFAARGALPPSHVTLSTKFMHTKYNATIVVTPGSISTDLVGANIRLVDKTTGATFDKRTSGFVNDDWELGQFMVPNGNYRVQVVTAGSAANPSKTYWYTGATTMTLDAARATSITVTYGASRLVKVKLP